MLAARRVANTIRTFVKLDLLHPWVKHGEFIRCPFSTSIFSPHRKVVLGNRVQFGKYCDIQCDLVMGNDILVAKYAAFVGRDDHRIDVVGKTIWDSGRGDRFEVVVGDDVWIGLNAIIVSGVTIGRGSVIAAGAVVSRDVPPYAIVGGNPARFIRWRFTEDEIERHERILAGGQRDANPAAAVERAATAKADE